MYSQNYKQMYIKEFDDIRCYNDEEVPAVLENLRNNKYFKYFMLQVLDLDTYKELLPVLAEVKTVAEFQKRFIVPALLFLEKTTTGGVSFTGLDKLDKDKAYLYITNHRDIVLDSAFINKILIPNNYKGTEIAIGSNLLITDWITDYVKINRSFVVTRDAPVRQMMVVSKILSQYIRYNINEKGHSTWIAQREGRTKDGKDSTQVALLKMLNLSGVKDIKQSFKNLSIIPVSISYEIEPCDNYKAKELYLKDTKTGYQKTPADDLNSMSDGITMKKGRVHYHFNEPIDFELDQINGKLNKNEQFEAVANIIDQKIWSSYKLWPNNYIAYDLVNFTNKYNTEYTKEEKETFIKMMEEKISTIKGDVQAIKDSYLSIYANPVVSKEELNG